MKKLLGWSAALALAACGPANRDSSDTAADAQPAPAQSAAAATAPLTLEGTGLKLSGNGSADAGVLPFGAPMAVTVEALTKALGRPPTGRGTNEECGGGGGLEYAEWEGEIIAWFESEGFVGWDNKGKLATAGGIGIGSSRGDLAALAGLAVEQSTLGTEFSAGGLGGLLASPAPGAVVTDMWGGSTCMFR